MKSQKFLWNERAIYSSAINNGVSKMAVGERQQTRVSVLSEICEVTAIHVSKTVWRAVGTYQGRHVESKGRSASSAIEHWKIAARMSDPWT